ncbi:MAG TPA: head maturation protease, ClpP-related, partial [Phycisphaerae bacterium]|nr:head maturation protease, ClpP-related [Phycisphaerae bacterium]
MKSWYEIKAQDRTATDPLEVFIYDEIGFWGISAAQFIRDLRAALPASEIVLRINSPGGEVFDGLAIYNYLRSEKTPVTVLVDGLAASIASVIAMAGDVVTMPSNAFLMVHNPWTFAVGDADELKKVGETLEKFNDSLVGIYAKRTGKDAAEIKALLDAETWMNGTEAVAEGFADLVTDAVEIAASAEMLTKIENMAGTKGREIADGIRAKQKEKADMKALDEARAALDAANLELQQAAAAVAERDTKLTDATQAILDAEAKIDVAYDEGMNAGVTAERIRVAALIEKYGPEFAAAHIGKTDEDVQAAWLAHLASGTAPVET